MLGAVPAPRGMGRLHWGLWAELGRGAQAGIGTQGGAGLLAPGSVGTVSPVSCRAGQADIPSAHWSWGFSAQSSLWEEGCGWWCLC